MGNLEFTFEQRGWESFLLRHQMGDSVSAAQLLTLLEGEEEQAVEDALLQLETGCMDLDLSDLPMTGAVGEAALRLRQEQGMAAKPHTQWQLEEGDPLGMYLEEIAATPAFGDEDLLAQQCAGGDENAMVQLTNLGLSRVVELSREYVGRGVLLLDLIQEGSLGLWQAIRSYHRGDYAPQRDRWIRFYMAREVLLQARASGVGLKMRSALEDYRAVDERLLGELGRNATLEEIAEELHMTAEEAAVVKKTLDNARLLAQSRKPEEEAEAEEDSQAVEDTSYFQMRQRIAELLSALGEQDRKLLTLRFGLEGSKPLTPEETGRRLGLTPEEVVAREGAALAKLRNR
ncbi:MAG: sigma-70 family RNA polymerase sigma factor [Oscillospiraceae bacterium]|nr:sigma-70 family RNA polymerase sigma factor [Oscillospiraceae bacterium]